MEEEEEEKKGGKDAAEKGDRAKGDRAKGDRRRGHGRGASEGGGGRRREIRYSTTPRSITILPYYHITILPYCVIILYNTV